jgi:hypothetical protein
MFVPDLAERTGIEPVTSDLQIPGSEPRLGQIRSVNGVGSGEEESERSRADVFCAQSEGSSGSNACSDEDEERLDEGGDRDVAADLAGLASAFDQRDERGGEAGAREGGVRARGR